MHSPIRPYAQPRIHRLELINDCALSDCCGAPIIQGGICFDCREHCEEEDVDARPARFGRSSHLPGPDTTEERLVRAKAQRRRISFRDEDAFGGFDGFSVNSVAD